MLACEPSRSNVPSWNAERKAGQAAMLMGTEEACRCPGPPRVGRVEDLESRIETKN